MSNTLTSFLFAIGVAAWVYNFSQKRFGGITEKSLTVAGVVGVIAFIVFLTIIGTLSSFLN